MGTRLAVVITAVCAAAGVVVTPASAADESITAHVTTVHPTVGHDLDITGQLTGAAMYPVMITVTRDDSTGSGTAAGTTETVDDQGDFTFTDKPPVRGSVTYHLTAQDASGATTGVTTTVARNATNLTISVTPRPADAETSVHVVARLDSPTTNRDLTISARPYKRARQQIDTGPVDANGNRSTDHAVTRRTTFIAAFAGDNTYAPTTARVTVRVRPVLDETLKGYFRTSGGVRIYHHTDNPKVLVHMVPEHKGYCLYFRAQHKSHGRWVRSAVSDCARTGSDGRVIGTLLGPDHIAGVPYRLRVEWHGSTALARRNGTWLRLEFR